MTKLLLEAGYATTVLDNLSNGHRDAVRGGEFARGDPEGVQKRILAFAIQEV